MHIAPEIFHLKLNSFKMNSCEKLESEILTFNSCGIGVCINACITMCVVKSCVFVRMSSVCLFNV